MRCKRIHIYRYNYSDRTSCYITRRQYNMRVCLRLYYKDNTHPGAQALNIFSIPAGCIYSFQTVGT